LLSSPIDVPAAAAPNGSTASAGYSKMPDGLVPDGLMPDACGSDDCVLIVTHSRVAYAP